MTKCLAAFIVSFVCLLPFAIIKAIINAVASRGKNPAPTQPTEKTEANPTEDKTVPPAQGDQPPSP